MDFGILLFGAYAFLERSGLKKTLPASYNVLVSNVPGPGSGEFYMLGSRLNGVAVDFIIAKGGGGQGVGPLLKNQGTQ